MILLLVCLTVIALALLGCEGMTARTLTIQQSDPVTGEMVNTNIWTEYQGQKVYFSSEQSRQEFLNDPAKYQNNLPQFRNKIEEKTGSYLQDPRSISGDNY